MSGLKSPFPPRRAARPPLASVAQGQVFREVRTEDELRRALDLVQGANALYGLSGRRIVIAAPITLRAPVIVGVPGVTIEAHGGVPLSVADGVAYAFDSGSAAGAYQVAFVGINFADPVDNRLPATAWINLGVDSIVDRCNAPLGGVLVKVDAVQGWSVRGCYAAHGVEEINVSGTGAGKGVIAGNRLAAGILLGAGAGACAITGNVNNAGGGAITTTAGAGGNAVVGNVGFTTTLHGGDVAAGNV